MSVVFFLCTGVCYSYTLHQKTPNFSNLKSVMLAIILYCGYSNYLPHALVFFNLEWLCNAIFSAFFFTAHYLNNLLDFLYNDFLQFDLERLLICDAMVGN